jgi:Fur family transcriptional regulator, peroxide stress response regulator
MNSRTAIPSNSEDTEQLRRALEATGRRYTRQRAAIYDHLRKAESHPTAEEVYLAVRRHIPKISLATVYKALEALVQCRLADKFTSSEGPVRYDSHSGSHYHFRCLRTGRIGDLDTAFDPGLVARVAPHLIQDLHKQGFVVTGYRLEVVGQFVN